jgi:hypothetical protein
MLNIHDFFENYMIEIELIFVFNNCKSEYQNLSLAFISNCLFHGEWLYVLLAVLLGSINLGLCVD